MTNPPTGMRIVDADRCLHVLEAWGDAAPLVSLGRLEPPSCTPKASILLIRWPQQPLVEV